MNEKKEIKAFINERIGFLQDEIQKGIDDLNKRANIRLDEQDRKLNTLIEENKQKTLDFQQELVIKMEAVVKNTKAFMAAAAKTELAEAKKILKKASTRYNKAANKLGYKDEE